ISCSHIHTVTFMQKTPVQKSLKNFKSAPVKRYKCWNKSITLKKIYQCYMVKVISAPICCGFISLEEDKRGFRNEHTTDEGRSAQIRPEGIQSRFNGRHERQF